MRRRISVFIASPGDLAAERMQFRKAIDQLNVGFADGANVEFEALGWEDTLASTGRRSQGVINEEIDRCDVFFLVMHRRWGQDAPDAAPYSSYTEEEFHRAFERWKNEKVPEIFVFFKRLDAASEADAGPQLKKVLAFRRELEKTRQVLYRYIDDGETSFLGEVDEHLRAYAKGDLSQPLQDVLRNSESKLPKSGLKEGIVETVEIKKIKLLVSSPSDVSDERNGVARAVFRFNQEAIEEHGLFIKLVMWEDMAPQIGPPAQRVINRQIGTYHIFIGIMWNRFGTPTEVSASGTKEEFDKAVQLWEKDSRPWISFYFCDRPANLGSIEQLEQKKLVLEFRKVLYSKGLVRSYQEIPEFEDRLYTDLKSITRRHEFLNSLEIPGR